MWELKYMGCNEEVDLPGGGQRLPHQRQSHRWRLTSPLGDMTCTRMWTNYRSFYLNGRGVSVDPGGAICNVSSGLAETPEYGVFVEASQFADLLRPPA